MKAQVSPAGIRGFDSNEVVTPTVAKAFRTAGFSFALRYIPRLKQAKNDMTPDELGSLFLADLAFMPVQHVESSVSWVPSADKGKLYGDNAAIFATKLGLSSGVTVWLDLEGVAPGTPAAATIAYCNNWYMSVSGAGFQPGLYVGWHAGLKGQELYQRLAFRRYWAAYNLNTDEYPAVRGVCMHQSVATPVEGSPLAVDFNDIFPDRLGSLPTLAVPTAWAPA